MTGAAGLAPLLPITCSRNNAPVLHRDTNRRRLLPELSVGNELHSLILQLNVFLKDLPLCWATPSGRYPAAAVPALGSAAPFGRFSSPCWCRGAHCTLGRLPGSIPAEAQPEACACHLKISRWFPLGVHALACTQPFCVALNKPDNFHSSIVTYSTFCLHNRNSFPCPPSSSFTDALHFQMLIIRSTKRLRSGYRLFDLCPVIYFHLSAFKCYFGFTLTY